jgi:outer membrane protein TolC
MNARVIGFPALLLLNFILMAPDALQADTATNLPETLLSRLQAERLPGHPLVQAARWQVEQAQAATEGVDGYFDTVFHAAAGLATWERPLPGSSLNTGIGENRFAIQSGLEQAVQPGLFIAAGAAERYLMDTGSRDRGLYQTMAGIQAAVPLLRNRGHAQWHQERLQSGAALEAARQDLLAVLQQLRRESDSTWIELNQAIADAAAYRRAGQRVKALLEETETLVRLQSVPEYQLYPSRMDTALREEEITVAEQRIASILLRLQSLLGELPTLPDDPEALPAWAARRLAGTESAAGDIAGAAERSGVMAALRSRIEAARAAEARARDAARPDLRLTLGGTWQAEDPDSLIGSEAMEEDDTLGVEAALVLKVPLQRRRERAAWRADTARAAEAEALLEQQRRLLETLLADTRNAMAATRLRMTQVGSAVENARLTLEAETERFRLGEGRSRNVLDAQKDLTAAELRRNAAAAALLQAAAALEFASAYPDGVLPDAAAVPAAQSLLHLSSGKDTP